MVRTMARLPVFFLIHSIRRATLFGRMMSCLRNARETRRKSRNIAPTFRPNPAKKPETMRKKASEVKKNMLSSSLSLITTAVAAP